LRICIPARRGQVREIEILEGDRQSDAYRARGQAVRPKLDCVQIDRVDVLNKVQWPSRRGGPKAAPWVAGLAIVRGNNQGLFARLQVVIEAEGLLGVALGEGTKVDKRGVGRIRRDMALGSTSAIKPASAVRAARRVSVLMLASREIVTAGGIMDSTRRSARRVRLFVFGGAGHADRRVH
jgi:hypothetical protein